MAQFTFKFSERELSIIQDVLDFAVETKYSNAFFNTGDIAEMASAVAGRLAY